MSKKIIAIVALIIVLLFIVAWNIFHKAPARDSSAATVAAALTSQTFPTPSSSTTTTQTSYLVSLTDDGYSPSTLTISAGETVTFINNSNGKMWTASGPHPAHTDYPGFDERSAANNGETYSFTFTKTGTWSYHNHLKHSQSGTIVVKSEN